MEIDNISPVYMPPLIKLRSFFNLNENFHSPLRYGTWNVLSQSLLVWLLYCDVYLFMDTLCKGLKGNCILVAIAWKLNKGLLCYLLAFILGMHSFLYILSIQRLPRLNEELLLYNIDILCLQEVSLIHYHYFNSIKTLAYRSTNSINLLYTQVITILMLSVMENYTDYTFYLKIILDFYIRYRSISIMIRVGHFHVKLITSD